MLVGSLRLLKAHTHTDRLCWPKLIRFFFRTVFGPRLRLRFRSWFRASGICFAGCSAFADCWSSRRRVCVAGHRRSDMERGIPLRGVRSGVAARSHVVLQCVWETKAFGHLHGARRYSHPVLHIHVSAVAEFCVSGNAAVRVSLWLLSRKVGLPLCVCVCGAQGCRMAALPGLASMRDVPATSEGLASRVSMVRSLSMCACNARSAGNPGLARPAASFPVRARLAHVVRKCVL